MSQPGAIQIQIEGTELPQLRLPGTFVWETLPQRDADGLAYVGAIVNHEIVSLQTRLDMNCHVRGLTARDADGIRIVRRSMGFLLAFCVRKVFPGAELCIHHSLGDGFYFTIRFPDDTREDAPLGAAVLEPLEQFMRSKIAQDRLILQYGCAYEEAVARFEAAGQGDKVALLRHINLPVVQLLQCEDFTDLAQGPIVNRLGALEVFSIIPYSQGAILQLPNTDDPFHVAPFQPNDALMRVHREHAQWGESMGIRWVGQLNQAVYDLQISDIIQMSEALHDKNFARIADAIVARQPVPRLVLMAGPSSAGKTTSSKRLGTHLRVNGYRPVTLSTDDYFVGAEHNPVDEQGNPDYEHLEAIDIPCFQSHLSDLLKGQAVPQRLFDFKTQQPVYTGEMLSLGPRDILIIEGIHALNPRLTEGIAREQKFLIFLSALTQLGIDHNNVLSTSDNRLIRRIVRDHLFRKHSARDTLALWPAVRRGEQRWIFPFQSEADATLNTALDYELSVLRPFVEPLLAEIKPHHAEYATARRLQMMLSNFHAITPLAVPGVSILREYIGGSLLEY